MAASLEDSELVDAGALAPTDQAPCDRRNECTIVVVLRDRFSTTTRCLESLLRNTAEPYTLLVVMGGVPEHLQKNWSARFGDQVRWLFEPTFLNPSEYRNIGLRETRTRLAVLMENDVYVHPGWLEPLIQCQADTGAAMVVPIVLDKEDEIHTAGNSLFVTELLRFSAPRRTGAAIFHRPTAAPDPFPQSQGNCRFDGGYDTFLGALAAMPPEGSTNRKRGGTGGSSTRQDGGTRSGEPIVVHRLATATRSA